MPDPARNFLVNHHRLKPQTSTSAHGTRRFVRSVPGPFNGGEIAADGDRPRVLIVDDEPEGREALRCALSLVGMTVSTAGSFTSAQSVLPTFVPDAVVSDLIMPGHSGFDLARELRRWRGTRGQRIAAIAISALSAPGIRQVALAAGFQEYFVKPFDTWTLVGAVETLHAMSIAHLRT